MENTTYKLGKAFLIQRIFSTDCCMKSRFNKKINFICSKLEDLVIEKNGRPIRSIILTTWRSGSTFLGDVLTAHPGNFYHYEPLLDFDIVQIRGPPLAAEALKNVRALLHCEYSDLGKVHLLDTYLLPRVSHNITFLYQFT